MTAPIRPAGSSELADEGARPRDAGAAEDFYVRTFAESLKARPLRLDQIGSLSPERTGAASIEVYMDGQPARASAHDLSRRWLGERRPARSGSDR